jgi:alkanesulfonate monooxygenase SsuD/methylene tetrahydromethanopterin reductase-like flavin-dependent oxidoreductase (luciferase family)
MRSFIAVLTLGAVLIAAPHASPKPSAAAGDGHEHHRKAGQSVHLSRDVATSWPVSQGKLAPKPTPAPSSPPLLGGGDSQLTAAQVAGYVRRAGFPESVVDTMVMIAARESGFNAHAVNISSGACGLFQLYPCPGLQALDPATNSALAYAKYQASGLAPWGF